jgi:RHS repeat-associated protein
LRPSIKYAARTNSFKYDPFGRRIYKSSSSTTSIYTYDGDNLIEETNSGGATVARYSQTQNIDEPLAMLRSASTSYYEADGLGSITSLSSGAGALAQTYTFDSFGKQTASTGSLVNAFQYTARESDPETGLYYYRARYYDSATGRFLSEDPLQFGGGDANLYAYVANSPTNLIDPSGLKPGDKYNGIDCAGWHAIKDIFPDTDRDGFERGGFIYQNADGTYSYSVPITGDSNQLPRRDFYNIPTPAGASRSGWYHTHPFGPGSDVFSPGDKAVSNHLDGTGVAYPNPVRGPGYLGIPNGSILKFVPVIDPTLGPGSHGGTVPLRKNPCGCN